MGLQRSTLSKIHIAKQQLGLDDDTYRDLLGRVCGVRSAKDLTSKQASRVLQEFERLGFQPVIAKGNKGRPHNFNSAAMPEMITKIGALLADMQLPWSYADGIARQMFGIQRCAWVRKPEQLEAIIAALHVEQEKRGLLASVEQLSRQLGYERPELVAGLEELPQGWERQRPILRSLVETLTAAVAARGTC